MPDYSIHPEQPCLENLMGIGALSRSIRSKRIPGGSHFSTPCAFVVYLDFNHNGSRLKPVRTQLVVPPYKGERAISELSIVPESHIQGLGNQNSPTLLTARGEKFWGFHGEPTY